MMEIIPAIDLIGGQCVRLSQGDFDQKTVYSSNPLEMAKRFEDSGLQCLHLVDLDGAKAGEPKHLSVLEQITKKTKLKVDFGGGVRDIEAMKSILNAGAVMISVGSLALKNKVLMKQAITELGANSFFIGADVRDEQITVSGWLEKSNVHVLDFIKEYAELGVEHFFCTDVAKDGMLQGPSIDLYRLIIQRFPEIRLTASGGVSSFDDLMALQQINCAGAIVGKALYENRITLESLKPFQHAG
jgi:phosphoribosylformimino-5-aminoimidazole carboxamide ribotide isomerase